ncbi:hypothetical protein Vafri_5839 [Volvox africanus]|nr:hypothetical protein Vafri_5839 [Volvox africanus]
MDTNSSTNLSQWVDILAGANCEPEPMNPQPYAVGLLTACITAEDMDCDAPIESVASSPGCVPRTSTAAHDWQVGGCALSSSIRDELDELLEELAQDTSCPYIKQLTMPNLMAACLPQPNEYDLAGTAAATDQGGSGSAGDSPLQPPLLGYESLQGALTVQSSSPESAVQLTPHVKPTSASMLLSCDASDPGLGFESRSEPFFVQPRAADATAVTEAVTGCSPTADGAAAIAPAAAVAVAAKAVRAATLPCGRSFPGLLTRLNGSQSGAGGEWDGASSDCQLLPYTAQLSRRVTVGPLSVHPLQPGGGGEGGVATTSGFAEHGGCCPVAVTHVPYIYRQHRTDADMPARVKGCPMRVSRDTTDFTDQPSPKDEREQWLVRSLRRLRSIVKIPVGSAFMKPCTTTTTTTTMAAVVVADRPTDVTAGAAAAAADAAMGSGSGCGRDVDDAGCMSDQHSDNYFCRGGSKGNGSGSGGGSGVDTATAAATSATTEALRSQVMLFAARLRKIPSRRKSL